MLVFIDAYKAIFDSNYIIIFIYKLKQDIISNICTTIQTQTVFTSFLVLIYLSLFVPVNQLLLGDVNLEIEIVKP